MLKKRGIKFQIERIIDTYPKFLLLSATIGIAYVLFQNQEMFGMAPILEKLHLFGIFIIGMAYAYGFTAAPATALLILLANNHNIILMGLIAGFGAYVSDILIFKFVRTSFVNEIISLKKERFIQSFSSWISPSIKKPLMVILAGFFIASPLPDEIGVTLLAAVTTIQQRLFSILSFTLNTAGIFVFLLIGVNI